MNRNYSKEVKSTYYKFASLPRNYTQEKRMLELYTLKESEVKVGIYKYSIDQELGKGYSSKVYKGVQIQKVHKRYAIKVIQLKKFRGSNLEMLQAEIQIHKNLVHQNVLRLHQVIKTPYFYYLVLEYCPHGNLHEYIRQKKKLTENNSIEIMEQILAGYKYLIQQGVIHRDLKPANILRIGNKWKISDFGFSVKSKYGFKDRINVGTPLYMSPESLKKSYYSNKTDIFALGIIMYEMLEGKTPWQSSNEKELLEKMKTEVILPQYYKMKVKQFISRCCQLNQTKRMSKQELMQFQIKSPISATQIQDKQSTKVSQRQSAVSISSKHISRKPSIVIQGKLPTPQDFTKINIEILNNEFLFVKHIYSCLKNIDSFIIENETRQIFTLSLFKMLLRLIRFLCDKNSNHFGLKNWNEFIGCAKFTQLYNEMVQYSEIFQKEYLQYIKHHDIRIIRSVNRKFPDLCHNAPISERFYQNLKEFMVKIIRQHNHELMLLQIESSKIQSNIQSKTQYKIVINLKQSQASELTSPLKAVSSSKCSKKGSSNIVPNSQSSIQYQQCLKSSLKKSEVKQQIDNQTQVKLQSNKSQVKQVSSSKASIKAQNQQIFQTPAKEISKPEQASKKVQQNNRDSNAIQQDTSKAVQLLNDKIQALQSLYTIYRIAEIRSHADNKQIATEKIKVIANYNQSKLEKRDYLDIRRLLRSL